MVWVDRLCWLSKVSLRKFRLRWFLYNKNCHEVNTFSHRQLNFLNAPSNNASLILFMCFQPEFQILFQILFNAIWELPTERVEEAIVAVLPPPTFNLPREKPVPKAKPLTKWEQYAKEKGNKIIHIHYFVLRNRKLTRSLC